MNIATILFGTAILSALFLLPVKLGKGQMRKLVIISAILTIFFCLYFISVLADPFTSASAGAFLLIFSPFLSLSFFLLMAAVIMATMVLKLDARGSIAAQVSLGQRIASIIVLGAFICGLVIIGGKSIRMNQAKNPQISGQKLTEMSASLFSSASEKRAIAENPNSPANLLEKLAQEKDEDLLRAVAENPNTSVETLTKIVDENTNYTPLSGVARNPKTPSTLLKKMVDYADAGFGAGIVGQTKKELYELSVLRAVAGHPNCTKEITEKLQLNPSSQVKFGLVGNPFTRCAKLEEFQHSADVRLAKEAKQNFESRCKAR